MTIQELIDQLEQCEDLSLPVMVRIQTADDVHRAEEIDVSVSAGCGEIPYCFIDGLADDGADEDEEEEEP